MNGSSFIIHHLSFIIHHSSFIIHHSSFIKMIKNITHLFAILLAINSLHAGNPDRQGEAGAHELLINPWARNAGLHAMNTATVRGVDALYQNIAGLARISGSTEVGIGNVTYLQGAGLSMNAIGLAQKVGEHGVMGLSINAFSLGKINVTTTDNPEGTGATYSPTFFNISFGYAHTFANKVSVGINCRLINEPLADVSAFGFSLDAGVQYVAGDETYPERFKFGVTLRNVGSPMQFSGQALREPVILPTGALTLQKKSGDFQLPSELQIGAAYDVLPGTNRLTILGNFTANSFSKDNIGAGVEFALGELFALRGGYKYELGKNDVVSLRSIYTGPCGGLSLQLPMDKLGKNICLDYGYIMSNPFKGTHNVTLRLNL
ncbi:MAG: hypothetical protein RLZZ628_1730 [Bacteroidota bacterium]